VHLAAAFAILIASGIMTVRVVVLVFAVSAGFASDLWIPLVAMAVPGAAASGFFWYKISKTGGGERTKHASDSLAVAESEGGEEIESLDEEAEDELEISNPFELAPALKFGLMFAVIIGGVHLAKQFFGNSGTYVAAFLSGLANMDAISVTIARMAESGDITNLIGVRGVVIGIVANSLSKAVLSAVVGSARELLSGGAPTADTAVSYSAETAETARVSGDAAAGGAGGVDLAALLADPLFVFFLGGLLTIVGLAAYWWVVEW